MEWYECLEEAIRHRDAAIAERDRLRAINAELLAALEFAYAHCDPTPGREEEWRCIPVAIARAKGGAT